MLSNSMILSHGNINKLPLKSKGKGKMGNWEARWPKPVLRAALGYAQQLKIDIEKKTHETPRLVRVQISRQLWKAKCEPKKFLLL